MHYIKGKSFADVYKQGLELVLNHPDYITRPRNYKVNECMHVMLEIEDPTNNLFENLVRSVPVDYVKKEIALYLAGTDSAEKFIKASKFWDRVKNNDGTVNSAYGKLIFNTPLKDGRSQFDWAFDSLKNDKDSRQAVIFFNRPDFQYPGNKDFVCTYSCVFHIRGNKLFMKASMRSNDIFRGTISDIPFFTLLQYMMYKKLKNNIYPDLELGSYIHQADSFHLYYDLVKTSDIDIVKNMLNNEFIENSIPLMDDPTEFIMSRRVLEYVENNIVHSESGLKNGDEMFWKWLLNVDFKKDK